MNSVVGWLALVGGLLVAWVRVMTLWTAALLAGAIVLDTLLARRVRAAWRVALYAPIALRVLLPQSWTFVLRHAPQMLTILTPRPLDLAPSPTHAAPLPSLGLAGVALLAYAAVALTIAFVLVRARQRMRARIASATPVEGELAKLPLPGPLLQHAELGPMVVGLFAPRIILPASLLATGDAYALALVLRHEAAHLARRDPWLTVAMQTLLVLAWPVVPLWVGAWRVRQLVELACDEAALAGADEGARRRYGHALLDVAEGRSVMLSPVTAELHFGSVLRARIEALGWTKRWPLAAQGMVVAGVAAGFVACSSVVAQGRGRHRRGARRSRTGTYSWRSIARPSSSGSLPREVSRESSRSGGSATNWKRSGPQSPRTISRPNRSRSAAAPRQSTRFGRLLGPPGRAMRSDRLGRIWRPPGRQAGQPRAIVLAYARLRHRSLRSCRRPTRSTSQE